MRTIKILLLLLLISSKSAFAFKQKVDTIVVSHDSCQVLQIFVTIDNTESEALWIWYDSNYHGQDYRKSISKYLKKRRGDFSIYDIGTDQNMCGEWWHPYAPKDCFVKYLKPGDIFTFVFYREMVSSFDHSVHKDIINDIQIFNNQQIIEICPGIEEPFSVKRISYPHRVVSFQITN